MKPTTFFLPDHVDALLTETRKAVLLDSRVVDVALQGVEPSDEESPCELAMRTWRTLLPDQSSGDILIFRTSIGWTRPEMLEIKNLLERVQTEMKEMAQWPTMLSGTKISLQRDADKMDDLILQWSEV